MGGIIGVFGHTIKRCLEVELRTMEAIVGYNMAGMEWD